jgi:hypothetical protein
MGRAVARRNNLPLKLDISYFENQDLRSYRLDYLNIEADIATKKEIQYFRPAHNQPIACTIDRIRRKLLPWNKQKMIRQHGFSYSPEIPKVKGSAYLNGYWQSEKYFIDIAGIIRTEFTFKCRPDETNAILLEKIGSKNAVSLHIRRGDYVSNPGTRRIHGILGLDYYIRAIALITRHIEKVHVFVFSDDILWARENLKISLPVDFMDHNGADKDYEDLRLLSHCKHHIIANSSFSWWGAWLAENQHKMVIAPRRWFTEMGMAKRQNKDIIPEGWIKL